MYSGNNVYLVKYAGNNVYLVSNIYPLQDGGPVDLGPQRPHGQFPPGSGVGPAYAVDLGPQRPHGQVPPGSGPPVDLGPQRPHGQVPPGSGPPVDLGPQRPHGQFPPGADVVDVHRLADDQGRGRPDKDLGPHRPAGMTDPNGPPGANGDLGPQRPSGQFPPGTRPPTAQQSAPVYDGAADAHKLADDKDLGPHRPAGLTDPNGPPSANGDLGPQRPSGQFPPGTRPPTAQQSARVYDVNAHKLAGDQGRGRPDKDLGPDRPAGLTDPNGPPGANGDLGPQRPSGQFPPGTRPPPPSQTYSADPIDLGPQRPQGQFPPTAALDEDDEVDGFRVFWNVPSFMCHRYGYPFSNLTGRYGVVQNDEDVFRGTHITILYDPGLYPALVDNDGTVFPRNGGVPQEGNLTLHLQRLQESIEDQVPIDFDGLGVIDFEAWRPVWAQNFGTLKAYQTYSIQLERTRDPTASDTTLQNRAKRRFEAAAKAFFLQSLYLAQRIRPNGRWGYYAFPYCFNTNDVNFDCSDNLRTQNSQIQWLFDASTALYPSVYLSKSDRSSDDQFLFITGKLREALRVAQGRNYVYPYFWYRYRDAGFLSDDDLRSCLAIPRALGMAGAIVWGSSGDMNSQNKCQTLNAQLESRLGPTIRKFSVTLSNQRVRQYVAQRAPNSG
ncbi:Hyaluronidase [Frankliniella fusca]|uniref:Hyaluronidase n=1 Tax=Frankliniella fusca TaxID=407009 RepID=A0AAE1H7G3_9NEOP|nr:Hyaluronidase [Frankliniella fusca]